MACSPSLFLCNSRVNCNLGFSFHWAIVQGIPFSFSATSSALLLLLSRIVERVCLDHAFQRTSSTLAPKTRTYLLGSWSCFRAMFLLAEPSSVFRVSGTACLPLWCSSLQKWIQHCVRFDWKKKQSSIVTSWAILLRVCSLTKDDIFNDNYARMHWGFLQKQLVDSF